MHTSRLITGYVTDINGDEQMKELADAMALVGREILCNVISISWPGTFLH